IDALKQTFSSYSFTDEETKKAMKSIYKNSNYITDPHGAVGYLGAKEYQKENTNSLCIFLETAHPVKFLDVVENTLDVQVAIPEQIKSVLYKNNISIKINNYKNLKYFLNKS
ncbi:MAG: threonine synthase, partial [Flavobacteriaceae bacterium]